MLWIRRHTRPTPPPAASTRQRQRLLLLIAVIAAAVYAASARADWVGNVGYAWNMSAPFSLTVESHADAAWTQRLAQSAADWTASGAVSVSVANRGKIALYDGFYGSGMPCAWTQYWQRGGNISHDAIYLNETCMASWSEYWKQYAICQELGHAIGLPDHNTAPTVASCMAPNLPSTAPGTDDFSELTLLYGTGTTSSAKSGGGKGSGGTGSTALSGAATASNASDSATVTIANDQSGGSPRGHSDASSAHGGNGGPGAAASHRP